MYYHVSDEIRVRPSGASPILEPWAAMRRWHARKWEHQWIYTCLCPNAAVSMCMSRYVNLSAGMCQVCAGMCMYYQTIYLWWPQQVGEVPYYDYCYLWCCWRDWLKVNLIISGHLQNHNNYIPIEHPTFQSAAAHRPVSLGRPGLRVATLGVRWLQLF